MSNADYVHVEAYTNVGALSIHSVGLNVVHALKLADVNNVQLATALWNNKIGTNVFVHLLQRPPAVDNQGRIRCGRIGVRCGLNQPTTPLSFSLPFHPSHSRPSPFYLSSPISLPLQGLRWVPRWYGRSPASHRRFLLHLTQPTANERFWCNINFEDLRRVIIAYNTENSKSKRAVKVS